MSMPSEQELEREVDEDIKEFDEWFQRLGNAPLSRPERAIIKTYIWHKRHPLAVPAAR